MKHLHSYFATSCSEAEPEPDEPTDDDGTDDGSTDTGSDDE